MSEEITISCPDGDFMAYLAKPSTGSGPAIVVIQEIFGVNAVMRGVADDLASQGYLAIVPDLFWRIEPGVQLTDKTKEEWDKAFALMNQFDPDKGTADIGHTISYLRGLDACTGKVGAVGYCLGGLLAYLTAARTDSDASVSYYGVNIDKYLGEQDKITKPLMLHVAENDQFVSKEQQQAMREGLAGNMQVEMHVYPGCDHAFARPGGEHFQPEAAKRADTRTEEFFAKHLR